MSRDPFVGMLRALSCEELLPQLPPPTRGRSRPAGATREDRGDHRCVSPRFGCRHIHDPLHSGCRAASSKGCVRLDRLADLAARQRKKGRPPLNDRALLQLARVFKEVWRMAFFSDSLAGSLRLKRHRVAGDLTHERVDIVVMLLSLARTWRESWNVRRCFAGIRSLGAHKQLPGVCRQAIHGVGFTLSQHFHFWGRSAGGWSAVPVSFTRAEALHPSASVQFAVQSGVSAAGDGGLGVSARSNLLRSSATSASRSAVSASTISNETLPESHSFRCPTCCPLR